MGLKRLDNVAVVVDDLDAAIAFFTELGMELEARMTVEGDWVDRIVGLRGTRSDIAVLRTPDGHGRLEALGGELVGEIVQYENSYRLCYLRGPEGIILALAEDVG